MLYECQSDAGIRYKHFRHESLTKNLESFPHLIPSNVCEDPRKGRLKDKLLITLIRKAESMDIKDDDIDDGFIDAVVDASFGALLKETWMKHMSI